MENSQNSQNDSIAFQAVVITSASPVQSKRNGATYVLHTLEITEGKLKGKLVTGSRTLLNEKGEEKEGVNKGDKVVAYARKSEQDGKWYFNISTLTVVTSNDEIDALMNGVTQNAEDALASQQI